MPAQREGGRLGRFAGPYGDWIWEAECAAEGGLDEGGGNRRRHVLTRGDVVDAIVS